MRGAVALAAALAIPLETDTGAAFPGRELIIFLAFCVILFTLVGQGMTLPTLIRALRIEDDGLDAREEAKARKRAAMAALERLAELEGEDWVMDETAGRLRGLYGFRVRRFGERFDESSDGANEAQSLSYQRLRRELLDAERDAVLTLRREGVVSDDVMNRVLRDIALEDVRLDFER
jgi:CPA1 family monovalent cation:H+ antiporter